MTPPQPLCPTTKQPACTEETAMENRRKPYVDKGFNVATILTMVVMLAGFFTWSLAQERRVAKLEEAIIRMDEAQRVSRSELKQDLREVIHQLTMLQNSLNRERK